MEALGNRCSVARIIICLMNRGRLVEYRLALELEYKGVEDLEEGKRTGIPESTRKKKRKQRHTGL
jgi:hypothetical protein